MTSSFGGKANGNITKSGIIDLYLRINARNICLVTRGQGEPVVLIFLKVEIFTPLDQIVNFIFELIFIQLLEFIVIERIIIKLLELLLEFGALKSSSRRQAQVFSLFLN